MRLSGYNRLERLCRLGIVLAALVILFCGILLLPKQHKNTDKKSEVFSGNPEEALADELLYYPEGIQLNEKMPELILYDEEGAQVKLSEFRGKNVLLLFWASWCKYCGQEFQNMEDFSELIGQYEDVELILVDKLDGEKETKELALSSLKEQHIPFCTYFDNNAQAYHSLGIKLMPTLLGIDSQGVLRCCRPGMTGGTDKLKALIEYVRQGGDFATERFITEKLMGEDGGIHTNYLQTGGASPCGYDVLSESQGLLMEYAVIKKDRELFRKSFEYVSKHMLLSNSLIGWKVAEGEEKAASNALVDDLRIYRALSQADELWGGYEEFLRQLGKSILEYNTGNNGFIDYYDVREGKKADRITLSFLDLDAISRLVKASESSTDLYGQSLKLVTEGYIGKEFPFYYSWYDYRKKSYSRENLNMAEALLTLLHLAEADELKRETIDWLEKALQEGGIKARYTVSGTVAEGFNYESTAVYAIAAEIGILTGNRNIVTNAIVRMEALRVNAAGDFFNGAFTAGKGDDIYSFDQCMALLAYGYLREASARFRNSGY